MSTYVLFDFDGVILDSFRSAFEVSKSICPHLSEEDYRRRFEGNIYDFDNYPGTHTDDCRHDIDFFAEYIPRIKQHAKMFDGMKGAIQKLADIHR